MIAINRAYNNTIGDNPHYVMFGSDRKHVVMWDTPEPFKPLYHFDDLSGIRGRQAKLAHQYVRDRMFPEIAKYQQKHNLHTRDRAKLTLNERVNAKHYAKLTEHPKMSPFWEGPYVVTKMH